MNSADDRLDLHRLSESENERIFRELIVPAYLSGFPRREHPVAVVLMAQPGAGKSRFSADVRGVLQTIGGAVEIDSDLYKPFHPQYARLMATDDRRMAAATRTDGRVWSGRVADYVMEHGLHTVVHDTAQDPRHSLGTLRRFRAAGYRIAVVALGVHESQSRQGILHRYQEQVHDRGSGRLTVPSSAVRSYQGILDAAGLIDESRAADLVAVYRRTVETTGPVHLNRLDPSGEWVDPPAFAEALETERNRPLTAEELRNFQSVQERLRSGLADELQTRLAEVDELARTVVHR